jgi:preprotein translocase subunit SecE
MPATFSRTRPQGNSVMSLLSHHFERAFDRSDRHAPKVRWATIKRVCARGLAVLVMVGVLAGLIALKTYIFLPRIMN